MTSRTTESACRIIRYLGLLFVSALGLATILATGGGGGGSSTSTLSSATSSSSIIGRAVKGPIAGATIEVFYFDEDGAEVEIASVAAPVLTDSTGSFNFPLDGKNLMGITSPLIVRASGGLMNGAPAPTLEGILDDPQPLTFAQVAMICNLSVASSVAAGLLKNYAGSIGAAPTLNDAKGFMALVENQLRVNLSENPFEKRTRIGMFNECIDQNLNLAAAPGNNPAVGELIDYFIANLSSSSGLLDEFMDDPANPGTDIPARFPSSSKLREVIPAGPAGFIFMNLTSDATYVENDRIDTANITAALMDAAGRPYQGLHEVQLGLVSGPGNLVSAGLSYARGEVLGKLTSDWTGDTGDVLVRTICPLSNKKEISLEVIVKSMDFQVDTDGDRFSDGDEELGWDIVIDELGYGSLATGALLNHRHVTSDPNLADTDGDGVSDYEEYLSRTDPRTADTDGDGLTDFEELYTWSTNPNSVDTDGDARGPGQDVTPNPAMFDGTELALYRTSPTLDDTDGDGRTDFEEIDHPTRSPLVSELPKLEMEIVDAVDVRLDVTYAEELGETYQYGNEMMKSTTRSTSSYNENSIEVGFEVKNEFGLFGGVEASLKFGYAHKWSTTKEEANTTQQSYSQYTTDSRTRTETAASGSMTAGIRLRNTGDIAYTISKLGIAVRHLEQVWNDDQQQLMKSFRTVATLVPTLGDGIALAPGESTPVLQAEAKGLNADRVKELLRRPDSLYLEDEYFELANAEGLNYAFLNEINLTRTASIVIDPGQGNAEEYRVATNVWRGFGGTYPGVTLGEILSDILHVDFATIGRQHVQTGSPTNERVLYRIRDLETNLTNPDLAFWTVVLMSKNPRAGLYDFDKMPVNAGDTVLLIYVRDVDGDGVNDLLEQYSGIHEAEKPDYDGDGLSDYDEVFVGWRVTWTDSTGKQHEYDVVSDPASTDQDADGLNDLQERTKGTNPSNPDTDSDGIPDGQDSFPLRQARVLYVDKDAAGANDGTSWANACTDLQAALEKARLAYGTTSSTDDVAEIWVADGVYKPGPCQGQTNPVYCSFKLVNTVGIYGGFRGSEDGYTGETKRSQRDSDPRTNSTILSGDLNDNDNVWPTDYRDNSCHVVTSDATIDKATALDGFTIIGGNAPGTQPNGGGVMLAGSGVMLRNLFFYDNHSIPGGGALRVKASNVTIRNCTFVENHSDQGGGAIYVEAYRNNVSIENCLIVGNSVGSDTEGANGGGIYAHWHTGLVIKNTDVVQNSTLTQSGVATWTQGGGVWVGDNSAARIENCRFIGNEARYLGGGLYVDQQSDVQIIQALFSENKTFMNNDDAYESGGGVCVGTGSSVAVANSTFINNKTNANGSSGSDGLGGGLYVISSSPPMKSLRIDNCVFWGNDTPQTNDLLSNQIWSSGGRDLSKWIINSSCIQSYGSHNYYTRIPGYGNIWEDPSLSETGVPKTGSPVIDSGNTHVDSEPLTAGFQTLPEIDLAGKPRLVDGDDDGVANVDMGAYEYQP
jgi:hypothetical protein